jgi:hypothetical protein
MPTREEINQKYLKMHNDLEREYYKTHAIDEATFNQLHGQLWKDHEQELINNGYRKRIYTYTFTREKPGLGTITASITLETQLTQDKIKKIETDHNVSFESETQSSVDVK